MKKIILKNKIDNRVLRTNDLPGVYAKEENKKLRISSQLAHPLSPKGTKAYSI